MKLFPMYFSLCLSIREAHLTNPDIFIEEEARRELLCSPPANTLSIYKNNTLQLDSLHSLSCEFILNAD